MENPFNPSFGKMPSVFLNRDSLTQRIVNELDRDMVTVYAFVCLCLSVLIFVYLLLGYYISYYIGLIGKFYYILIEVKKWIIYMF